MDQQNRAPGGAANTPPFGDGRSAVDTAADHQIPDHTEAAHGAASGGRAMQDTERELERTRDMLAEAAAPVMAEKTQEAIEETADRLAHDPAAKEQMKRTATAVKNDAERMARQKADQLADAAEERVNRGMDRAASRVDRAAKQVDELADQRLTGGGVKGQAGQMAHSLADSMESVANYLRDNDVDGLRQDVGRQLRERPLQTLLVAVAAGWVTGKILR
ncbi:MAG TPA: hypothetical protein VFI96_03925 [Longimicrobiaceae bacterium]|nr:hypothetical protein [Longimicrobiaceae bacterium]